jgi:hypothetical protein
MRRAASGLHQAENVARRGLDRRAVPAREQRLVHQPAADADEGGAAAR